MLFAIFNIDKVNKENVALGDEVDDLTFQNSSFKRIAEANNDASPIEHDAKNLKILLTNEHPEFLEFIIAVLYRLAHSDGVYSVAEDEDIREVAKIFGVTKKSSDVIYDFFSNTFDKIRFFILKKVKNNA